MKGEAFRSPVFTAVMTESFEGRMDAIATGK
jgi:hypothetical protein